MVISNVETYLSWICLSSTFFWMKWYWVSTCLFLEWYLGFSFKAITFWLSQWIGVGLDCEKPSSCNNFRNQTSYVVAFVYTKYSNFVENNATNYCFLLLLGYDCFSIMSVHKAISLRLFVIAKKDTFMKMCIQFVSFLLVNKNMCFTPKDSKVRYIGCLPNHSP